MIRAYPETGIERDRWILDRRGARNPLDPCKPHAFLIEEERAASGEVVSIATIFLTNRECPWRCLMCDLWKNTLTDTVPLGAIPTQMDYALSRLNGPGSASNQPEPGQEREGMETAHQIQQIKLYNSGSFFDPRAIPPADHEAIAWRVAAFERVIVECHPALVGKSVLKFRDLLRDGRGPGHAPTAGLEVAMGLETAHPEILAKLNKRMTLDQFRRAADFLRVNNIALRVFVLVQPPFLDNSEALPWARRSIDFAFDCGASVVSLIPTRSGNGALDVLAGLGEFRPPSLATLEAALDYGITVKRGRVFADLWDLEKFSDCPACLDPRRSRLKEMNLQQVVLPRVVCGRCESQAPARNHPAGSR